MAKVKRKTIEDAISLFKGNERELARATGYSQHAIWKARTGRLAKGISAEMAIAIEHATNGRVPAEDLSTAIAHRRGRD